MEKRIGIVAIMVSEGSAVNSINTALSEFSQCIRGRLGLPCPDKKMNLISIIFEGTTDDFGALTGKLGRIEGVKSRSLMMT